MKNVKTTQIDSLKEREELYALIKKRIEVLVEKEKVEGLTPELRESIATANALLTQIRIESSGTDLNPDELRDRAFGDWLEKKKREKNEECEVSE